METIEKRLSPFLKQISKFKCDPDNQTPVSWQEFSQNLIKYSGRRVIVYQKDFASGTLRIQAGCWLQLGENISFNPNRGFDCGVAPEILKCDSTLSNGKNWFPTHKQLKKKYDKDAYRLGFFTAIAVETSDVWIDLNGFTLEQSLEHKLMQRFYSNIELTDQPFLPKQGPAHFGPDVDPAENVVISGGTLGRSCHHSVHGNNNKNILFYDLKLKEYETAGISLNGAEGVTYYKVDLEGNDTNIPVIGTFSALRFMDHFVLAYLRQSECKELLNKLKISRLAQQQIFYNVILKKKGLICGVDAKLRKQIDENFLNPSGLFDGNAYGILHHHSGVAVNSFLENVEEYKTKNIYLHEVNIKNTRANVTEIVALAKRVVVVPGVDKTPPIFTYKNLVDVAGSILQINKILHSDGRYKYTIISDYKISLAKYVNRLPQERRKHYGTLFIPDEICKWAASGDSISRYLESGDYRRVRNGDSMNHQQKAVLAIRMDGVAGVVLNKVNITETFNHGKDGIYDKYYVSSKDGGHPSQSGNNPNLGYTGADARGIGFFCVNGFVLNDVNIKKVVSHYGKSVGIDIHGKSIGSILNSNVSYILAGAASKLEYGPTKNTNVPFACGVSVAMESQTNLTKVHVSKVSGGSVWIKSIKFKINNNMSNLVNSRTKVRELLNGGGGGAREEVINLMFMFIILLVLILFLLYINKRYAKK